MKLTSKTTDDVFRGATDLPPRSSSLQDPDEARLLNDDQTDPHIRRFLLQLAGRVRALELKLAEPPSATVTSIASVSSMSTTMAAPTPLVQPRTQELNKLLEVKPGNRAPRIKIPPRTTQSVLATPGNRIVDSRAAALNRNNAKRPATETATPSGPVISKAAKQYKDVVAMIHANPAQSLSYDFAPQESRMNGLLRRAARPELRRADPVARKRTRGPKPQSW